MDKPVTIRQLVLKIIALFFFASLAVELFTGFYLKERTLETLAIEDARRTSELVFENIYTKMQGMWTKKDIQEILGRLNALHRDLKIGVYRSALVEAQYGRIEEDHLKLASDPLVQRAMKGEENISTIEKGTIRYLFPVRVEKRCLSCHTNAKVGDINGVVDIVLPIRQIVVSLDRMIYYFTLLFAIFLFIFFFFFYKVFKKNLVDPLTSLSKKIADVDVDENLGKPIRVDSNCHECLLLERSFNSLILKIRFYYDRLLDSYLTDPLTGLGNINRFKRDTEGKAATMLLMNVDRFKDLNDYYGFETGDKLLREIAAKLETVVPEGAKLYRIGGSEFAMVCFDAFDPNEVIDILEKIHDMTFETPGLEELRISMTAGIVQMQKERLIEKASIALNAAKERNKPFEYYRNSGEIEESYELHIRWMKEVEDAIKEDRLILHYQPILNLGDPKEKKYEALIRLVDREGKIHAPGEFLGVVQKSRLYAQITRIVIEKSFDAFSHCNCSFGINLSINDIKDEMCRNTIFELLRHYQNPERVTFEILESEEVSDFELVNSFIENIHALGAKVAIDDFGSGYSNFHYLLKMDVDYYKIDASLIRHIVEDEDSRLLVEIIVDFANKLGIKTVAEYVENEAIAECCKAIGIDYLQGYHIGKPGPLCEDKPIRL
ncbi:EAL domain-containing protein [Hydrogenimonas urashimensis]|uniref:EAL domain-containing protein n=1 Tax=Hydrogenimonas urashimensis TaxID=2740515 RepID=UPI0019168F13|nr:EAL domain-containing protein [Hydrogenimonas urashimensis]